MAFYASFFLFISFYFILSFVILALCGSSSEKAELVFILHSINFHSFKLLTVLVVTLENNKVVRFYNWQFDTQTQQSIKCWYKKNKSSCDKLQQTPCNA